MKRIALTGGIGSGKSTVARIFGLLGIAVYDSDTLARALMESDAGLLEAIAGEFDGVYTNGRLNRGALAARVFGDKEALERLNSLVHPIVERDFYRWVEQQRGEYVVLESAIIMENGLQWGFDAIVAVLAPAQMRIRRVMERNGMQREEVMARMATQLTDSERAERAGYTIINDGHHSLWEQVLMLNAQFLMLGA